ncbi:beta-ketoacyl-[acyl-carrier-protein] synthase family protein [Bremerella alba]|uniref:3-oxoacyl-[acyl-carrier-protein] synthase 2 n=1 Tax=Bremerella alba TaxID=980252 RepID=A0A7V8V4I6_9BACT|nr:beta-ketoacyl synthase N-terminal-like domain-containing protein [Bremerella alba]MBA2114808.1 3-oxoacyl-[acyl-carrier-protein] synthase 2 [Bremerella alba]
MQSQVEVVITGNGVVSPIGIGNQAIWESLMAGKSGIAPLSVFTMPDYPVTFGGELKDFDGKKYVKPRKALKVMCREIQTGFAAAALAMDQAGLEPGSIDPDRLGVVYGSEMMYSDFEDLRDAYDQCIEEGWYQHDRWGPSAMSETNPLWMLKYLPNMPACHVGIYYDGRGHNNTICLEEASAINAFSEALSHLRRGTMDCMIAGATGSRLNLNVLLYRGDSLLSHRNEEPEKASRPFEKDRDGAVSSEAAAAMVLETREKAEARGANILGKVLGASSTFGRITPEAPVSPEAVKNCINATLRDAGITKDDLACIISHGSGNIADDPLEAQGIKAALPGVPVAALKSYYGNSGSACGALDAAVAVLALQHGKVPATLNYDTPDPACDIPIIHGQPLDIDKSAILILSHTRKGQCAAMVVASA